MPKAPKQQRNTISRNNAEGAKQQGELQPASPAVDPARAPVPKPKVDQLTPMTSGRHVRRKAKKQEKEIVRKGQHVAKAWLEFVPSFFIKGVDLPFLLSRPKNGDKDKEHARAVVQELESNGVEPDACSARFVDEHGNVLACIFANRISPRNQEGEPEPYPGSQGRTLQDVDKTPEKSKFYDGLPVLPCLRYQEATQELHAHLPPIANPRDLRHPDDSTMQYTVDGDPPLVRHERAGVTHLVHAWHQQGHPNTPMTMSKDILGRNTAKGALAVERYFMATRPIALYLKELFRVSYPVYFKKYEPAFKAGRWIKADPGPWLGRAIVWKLQVDIHMDGRDEGPTAIFNLGNFEGGILYLPDLRLKISYRPRDVIIFLSGRLYHSVSPWTPGVAKQEDKLTPGRVSTVFFFPEASYKGLKDKPTDWIRNTQGGSSFNASESKKQL